MSRWLLLGLVGVCGCSSASTPPPPPPPTVAAVVPPAFEDVTTRANVQFTYRNGEESNHFAIIESMGGGVAVFDFDNDGFVDLFFPGGGFFEGTTVGGHPCRLFRNRHDGTFEDVSAAVGLTGPWTYSHGAAAFDFDCDGWTDVLITGYRKLLLLKNVPAAGGGRAFQNVTTTAKLTDALWSTSAGWGDLDADGFPDLYIAHYGDWGFDTNHPTDCQYDGRTRDVCQPRRFKPLPHTVYRNNRDGTFTDVSATLGLRTDGKGIGVLVVDVNRDGRPDVYVANDTDDNFLYMNRGRPGELRLQEVGLTARVARDDRGNTNGSMGLDAGDFDGSGRPSIIVTNYENELPALYQNRFADGRELFSFETPSSGLGAVGGNYVSWGTAFVDIDRDTFEDLLIVSGHAIRYPAAKFGRQQKPLWLRNTAGKFSPADSGGDYFSTRHNARGLAVADLDNDGRPDLVVSHLNEPVTVLRNVSAGGNWLGLDLRRPGHKDIVGTRVTVTVSGRTLTRFVKGGGSYASTHDRRLLFGLGSAVAVEAVTVTWPDGAVQSLGGLGPNAYHTVRQPD